MNKINPGMVKSIIEKFLTALEAPHNGVELVSDQEDGVIRFLIKTNEPNILIGQGGATLLAVNHVIRRIVERSMGEGDGISFIVDVNNYQKNKIDELKQKANMMAERARFFKSSVELEPMSSYERMIIHSHLVPTSDITTESVGLGPSRRVVIKYKESNI